MKQVYLAHPLSAPSKEGILQNIARAKLWYKWACDRYWPDHCFNAMWIINCEVYEDANSRERDIGMQRNYAHIKRCDELWLVGPVVTSGMEDEGNFARRCTQPVYNLTGFDKPPLERLSDSRMPVWKPGSLSQQALF